MTGEVDLIPGHPPRVLIADDEADARRMLFDWLTYQGYEVVVAAGGEEALALAAKQPLDLALVDMVMPGPSGMALAERLKELWPEMEVIIITAYGSIVDAAEAMRRGAFHYLPKPLGMKLLQATVEEALAVQRARTQVRVGELVVDLQAGQVSLRGEPVKLTSLEERLLVCLARRQEQAVGYDELWGTVWGYDGSPDKRVIQKAASRLRERLGEEWIVAVRGRGYRLR